MTLQDQIELAKAHLECDASFRTCVDQALNELELAPIQLANALAVSRTTVLRWQNGRAVPHPAMRKPVYKVLEQFLIRSTLV